MAQPNSRANATLPSAAPANANSSSAFRTDAALQPGYRQTQPGSSSNNPYGHSATMSGPGFQGVRSATNNPQNKPPPARGQLNVRDALSYLDDVKVKFSQAPEVYNRFLDVMKDFKTQTIDTPAVIRRVSDLFRGHPSLIEGFNTFLPPGYRIECSTDPSEPDLITVTTPSGTTTHTQLGGSNDRVTAETRPGQQSQQQQQPLPPTISVSAAGPSTTTHTTLPESGPYAAPASVPQSSIAPPTAHPIPSTSPNPGNNIVATPGAASILGIAQRPPVEFNHAINYVNKIKTRFAGDPSTYKVFLEILQTYQKEQRPIQEVYAQVTTLFASAPDLLDEFKQFLPENSSGPSALGGPAGGFAPPMDKRSASAALPGQPKKKPRTTPAAGASSLTAAAQGQEDKRRKKMGFDGSATAKGRSINSSRGRGRGGKSTTARDVSPPMLSPPPPSSTLPASPYPKGAHGLPGQTLVSMDELSFFERAKKHMDDRDVYQEFLKTLNLFSCDIITLPVLMEKIYLFLYSNEELFAEFKTLVGWDPTEYGLVDGEEWMIENVDALERPRIDLNTLPSEGPSYKKLPHSEVELACSGRDALCWSVLNDDWVAHATWASEGSGAHKKNLSEEALGLSEQERHWFSVVIETNRRAIALIDPIAARLKVMHPDDKATFKLNPNFGGSSASVIEKAIRKIYGSDAVGAASGTRTDHALEVINAFYDNPSISIPIILNRMRQKNQDWKRALKDWNKVWREVDVKNYYRSLDHQGGAFKVNDKKTITSKSFVTEIEQLRADQQQKRVAAGVEISELDMARTDRSRHQFELKMDDRSVIFDVLRLTFSFLDRPNSGFSAPERERVEGFLRLFVSMVFNIDREEMENVLGALVLKHHDEDDEGESDADGMSETGARDENTTNGSSTPKSRTGPKAVAADLRRRLLSHAHGLAKASGKTPNPETNGFSHPDQTASSSKATESWIQASTIPWPDSNRKRRHGSPVKGDSPAPPPVETDGRRYNFYTNLTFYCLIRTFHLLYHRLSTVKNAATELVIQREQAPRLNPLAVELGLAQPLPIIDVPTVEGVSPPSQYYDHSLDLCERLFDTDIDQNTFEEHLRYMWGTKAFPLFTIDKLVAALIKHTHAINSDSKCQELMLLLEKDRSIEQTTIRQQITYRMEAEATVVDDEYLYRIEWLPEASVLVLQLLGQSDLTLDDVLRTPEQRFEYYASSFVLPSQTEGIPTTVSAPVLKRNHRLATLNSDKPVEAHTDLEVKIGLNSFRLFFVAKTGDYIHRKIDEEPTDEETLETERKKRFDAWFSEVAL